MGYKEAQEDGIRSVQDKYPFGSIYYIPCKICGKEVKSLSYRRELEYICRECREKKKEEDRLSKIEENKEGKEKKLGNAIKRIYAVTEDIALYDKAIARVKKHLYNPHYFDSTEEIMVALELLKNKISFIHQQPIGQYRVDFYLPDKKVVLEIDGGIFHDGARKKYDAVRDEFIVNKLGDEWEVVRIDTKYVNQNITKLAEAIDSVCERRAEIRKSWDGKIPKHYK